MGKKLDALLGRKLRTSKFKATTALAVSRLAVLKNQRQARCSIARSDVVEFLKNSNHERALLRVEQVIKEQNMLDVFVVLEGYCYLLVERIHLFEQEKGCPEELTEAVSTLIYASTRCGDFPELKEIRAIFTSRYGKEFAARAVELRNNCGVNPTIVHKLSTRMPSLDNKMRVLKEIASDNNIELPIEETVSVTIMENQDSDQEKKQKSSPPASSGVSESDQGERKLIQHDEIETSEEFSDSFKMRRKYRDVGDAAQAAFESAAYAAAAARAAVELSRSESRDPDDHSSPNIRPRKLTATIEPMETKLLILEKESVEDEHMRSEVKFEKIHPVQNYDLETKNGSLHVQTGMEQFKLNEDGTVYKRSFSASSSDSSDDDGKGGGISFDERGQNKQKDDVFDESYGEDKHKSRYDLDADQKNDIVEGSNRSQSIEPLKINRMPISVRTRKAYGL